MNLRANVIERCRITKLQKTSITDGRCVRRICLFSETRIRTMRVSLEGQYVIDPWVTERKGKQKEKLLKVSQHCEQRKSRISMIVRERYDAYYRSWLLLYTVQEDANYTIRCHLESCMWRVCAITADNLRFFQDEAMPIPSRRTDVRLIDGQANYKRLCVYRISSLAWRHDQACSLMVLIPRWMMM